MRKFYLLTVGLLCLIAAGCCGKNSAPQENPQTADLRNLLVNSGFNFHPFMPHRTGIAGSYVADYVPFWNADTASSLRVFRDSHIPANVLPTFAVPCGVQLFPGQSFHQFFTLPEADLLPGDAVSLSFYGYQDTPGALKGSVRVMKIESEDGTWSPGKDFKFRDQRTFNKMARGELVAAKEITAVSEITKKNVRFKTENLIIPGNFTPGKKSYSKDCNSVGIEVRFTNTSKTNVWIFAPSLVRGNTAFKAIGNYRSIPEYYRHIPRTMQKLWKGESVHILVMGSSIDRGSANPPLYPYCEDPKSPKYKQPLSDSHTGFSTKVVGRPDLEPYFDWSNHYFSYAGRLKVELMKKYNLPGDKILLHFMAADGSCVGEAHSGLKAYCELQLPPSGGTNGHKDGKSWKELYPGLFSRPEGPRPDLVIFGSGANEKTDTPDECAVFEGTIRYIQRNYPGTEFIGCMFQNYGGYTPNPSDMQAIALRYGIPFVDFGIVGDRLVRCINRNAMGNSDGHPQASFHYLWFKQLEKAFDCAGPVVSGFPQSHLPERIMPATVNWEGEMKLYRRGNPRLFRPAAIIIDDSAFNAWAYPAKAVKRGTPTPRSDLYVDGIQTHKQRRMCGFNLRNSFAQHGRLSFGDRHVVEAAAPFIFGGVDAKQIVNRSYIGVESSLFSCSKKAAAYKSQTGYPYGKYTVTLNPGESCAVSVIGNAFAITWVDVEKGGVLKAAVNGKTVFEVPTDKPFTLLTKEKLFMENRKGVQGLPYGVHEIKLTAVKAPVKVMGVFSYDLRANRSNERIVRGFSAGGEFCFEPAFKAVPVIRCSGNLKLVNASAGKAVFSGNGQFEAIGE